MSPSPTAMSHLHSQLRQSKSCNHIWSPRSREEQFPECPEGKELEILERCMDACRGMHLSNSWNPHVSVPPDSKAFKKWSCWTEVSGINCTTGSGRALVFIRTANTIVPTSYVPGHVMLTVPTGLMDFLCSPIDSVWRLVYLWPWERGLPVSILFCAPYWK